MLNVFLAVAAPLLLVFGLYHMLVWFDVLGVSSRPHWQRVGLAATVAHFVLVTGFFAFTYFDFQSNRTYVAMGMNYSTFLFRHSAFWNLLPIFDTVPMLGIMATFWAVDRAGIPQGALLPLAGAITYVLGTLQWFYVGGGIGAVLDKFWEGLKTGDDEEEWFQ